MEEKASISVIYEHKDFVAVYKPAGLLAHGIMAKQSQNQPSETVVDWAVTRYPEVRKVGDSPEIRPGIVHRLDKDTSGILIIARNNAFFDYFKGLLAHHKVGKRYYALVWGKLDKKGIIDAPIGLKSGTTRHTTHIKGQKLVKPAVTAYRALEHLSYGRDDFTFAELMPKTGRTHQLRVHMASIGHPVVGDALYGKKTAPFAVSRQLLHANTLEFELPDGGMLQLEAPLPDDFKTVLRILRENKKSR